MSSHSNRFLKIFDQFFDFLLEKKNSEPRQFENLAISNFRASPFEFESARFYCIRGTITELPIYFAFYNQVATRLDEMRSRYKGNFSLNLFENTYLLVLYNIIRAMEKV